MLILKTEISVRKYRRSLNGKKIPEIRNNGKKIPEIRNNGKKIPGKQEYR
jgi:hypothetical protein